MSSNVNIASNPSPTQRVSTTVRLRDVERSYYLITFPGILKIFQMIFTAVCFIRMRLSPSSEHVRAFWLCISAGCGFSVTCVLFLFFCFNLINRARKTTWIFETIFCLLWTVFLLITAIIVVIWGIKREGYITAGIFGLLAALFYGLDSFYKCRSWMRNDFTFGDENVIAAIRKPKTATRTTSVVVTPPVTTPT